MTDKQIIGGRGSAKPYTTLNTIVVMLENEKLQEALKAKEQECERLRFPMQDTNYAILAKEEFEQLEAYKMEAEEGKEINAELKAENDELKETFDGLFKVQYQLADNNKKLRQCLTEIKEIAEHCINQDICTFCDYSDRCHIEDEEIPTYDICKLILQKISECEGNDENNIFPLS